MIWTAAQLEHLKRLLKETSDRQYIADQIGTTTSSVNGKIFREGLAEIKTPAVQKHRASLRQSRARKPLTPTNPPYDAQSAKVIARVDWEKEQIGIEDLITLQDRPVDGCCFPVGDAKQDPRVYCPNQRMSAIEYCEFHFKLMWPEEAGWRMLIKRKQYGRKTRERGYEEAI